MPYQCESGMGTGTIIINLNYNNGQIIVHPCFTIILISICSGGHRMARIKFISLNLQIMGMQIHSSIPLLFRAKQQTIHQDLQEPVLT